jgi:hypothetical protein
MQIALEEMEKEEQRKETPTKPSGFVDQALNIVSSLFDC